jgi:hypothetical protein
MFQMSDARYVRIGGLPGNTDIKTYDCANFFLAVQGQVANSTIGELHVRYTVELSVPVIEDVVQAPINYSVTSFQDTSASLTTTTAYQPLLNAASSTSVVKVNGIGVVNTAGSIVPPAGNYLWFANVTFTCSGNNLNSTVLDFLKNAIIQGNASTNTPSTGAASDVISVSNNGFISCNGTDAITLSIQAIFSGGTTTATTVFTLVAI